MLFVFSKVDVEIFLSDPNELVGPLKGLSTSFDRKY